MTIWTANRGTPLSRRLALASLACAVPLLAAGYQVAAETSAQSLKGQRFGADWLGSFLVLPSTWALLALEAASFAVWMLVLSQMKLAAAFPLSAVSYVLI